MMLHSWVPGCYELNVNAPAWFVPLGHATDDVSYIDAWDGELSLITAYRTMSMFQLKHADDVVVFVSMRV